MVATFEVSLTVRAWGFALLTAACGSSGAGTPSPPVVAGAAGASGSSGGASGAGGAAIGGAAGTTAQANGGAAVAGAAGNAAGAGGSNEGGAGGAGGQGLGGAGRGGGGTSGTGTGGGGTLQIMPLGDSITFGFNGTNAGYRGPLYDLLVKSGRSVVYVGSSVEGPVTTAVNPLPVSQRHNEGHGSYSISDIDNNLDGLDTKTFEQYGGADRDPKGGHWLDGIANGANARPPVFPDVITLMIGTNNSGDPDRAAVQTQLHALLTKLTTLRPSTRLIVAQITPSNRPNNVSYNTVVASEVASLQAAGKHVSVVDMYTNFPANGLYSDGVHPNDVGFAFMSQQWFDAIAKLTFAP